MSNHETFVIRDSNVEQTDGQNSTIYDILYLENLVFSRYKNKINSNDAIIQSDFEGISARQFTIINVCGKNSKLYFGAAKIDQLFEARSISLGELNLAHSSGRSMVLFGEPINRVIPDVELSDESVSDDNSSTDNEMFSQRFEIKDKPWERCDARNEFDKISMNGAQFNEVRLSGAFNTELSIRGIRASRVLFNDQHISFGSDATINARDARIQNLSVPKAGFRSENSEPIALDLMGSELGVLKWFEPGKDLTLTRNETPALDTSDVGCAFFDCVLRSASMATGPNQYNPYIYNVLIASAKSLGMNSEARRLLIAKNDDYRKSLANGDGNLGEWLVYFLGKYVNEYGYNNLRGFLWLFAIWAFGALVYSADRWSRLCENSASAEFIGPKLNQRSLDREAPTIYAVFGSLDRTVPTLGLDTEFGTVRGLHPVQTSLIYLQRFLAFVVIAIMLGGLFDFFQ